MSENNLPSWRQELKSARKKEGKAPSNRWIQLATININNKPRLRTVVFRGWKEDNSMLIFTDKRSEKVEHIKNNPNSEILWFFFKSKTQFRFKGRMNELLDNSYFWETLSEKSKLTWFWEYPGHKLSKELKTDNLITTNLHKPENFAVLQFQIQSVDLLKLEQPIHKRYLWEKDNKWKKIEINP